MRKLVLFVVCSIVCLAVQSVYACGGGGEQPQQPNDSVQQPVNSAHPQIPALKNDEQEVPVLPKSSQTPPAGSSEEQIRFAGKIVSIEWIIVKSPQKTYYAAPVVNGLLPTRASDGSFKYELKIAFTDARRKLYANQGYLEFTKSTPEIIAQFKKQEMALAASNR